MFNRADVFFLFAAAVAFIFTNYLFFTGDIKTAFFVMTWVPSNLILAVYFKRLRSEQ